MSDKIRIERNRNYTVMSNIHLFDKKLTLKAKGILSLCLALPDNWDYSISGLCKMSDDGRDSVRSSLKNLIDNGYLKVKNVRQKTGQFLTEYTFYEQSTVSENPHRENRIGETVSENPTELNTKINHDNTNVLSCTKTNRETKIKKLFIPPKVEEVAEYCEERQNGINAQYFVDYYQSKGWYVGKSKMKDWKASVRTWEQNCKKEEKPQIEQKYHYE